MTRLCLNSSTVREQGLTLPELIAEAAGAGYQSIEPWTEEIERYRAGGGRLADLRSCAADQGIAIENLIGFAELIVDDDGRRAAGLDIARKDMETAAALGAKTIAAPPAGATEQSIDLRRAAARYRALLEIGARAGITPLLEVWGHSRTLSRLSEACFVASEAGDARAALLVDVYHLHKGGSPLAGLSLLRGSAIGLVHVNDFPGDVAPADLTDAHRVYPGDGAAPLHEWSRRLQEIGYTGALSVELFNPGYWKQPASEVARAGAAKTRAAFNLSR